MSGPILPPPAENGGRWQRIALLVGVLAVLWLALDLFGAVLQPFVAAAGIAYFLDPLACRLQRAGVGRQAGALVLLAGLLAVMLLFVLLLYPLILSQLGILISRLPAYVNQMQRLAAGAITQLQAQLGTEFVNSKLRDLVGGQAGAILGFVGAALRQIVGGGFALFNVLTLVVVTPVVAFYLLRDWPAILGSVDLWLPRHYAPTIRAQAREVDRILSAWLRGQAMVCVALGAYYALALTVAGLDLGLIVGLTAGLLSFIPYVGSITGLVSATLLATAQFGTWPRVLMVMAACFSGQLLEGYVFYPRFLGDRVELHAVWVIFALFAGGAAFGFVGVLLAVPVAAVIGVICRYWLARYMASHLYNDLPL